MIETVYKAFIDGGKKPGTGQMTIGGIIYKDGIKLDSYSKLLGKGSNNEAELFSFIHCIELVKSHRISSLIVYTDSKIVENIKKNEFYIISTMVSEFEKQPKNKGLFKAIIKRLRNVEDFPRVRMIDINYIKNWIFKNQYVLENTQAINNINPDLSNKINFLIKDLDLSIGLISREQNKIADRLCRNARKK